MKTIYITLIIGLPFLTAPIKSVFTQNSKKQIECNGSKNFMISIHNLAALQNPDLTGTNILSRNEINIWAERDFLDRFAQVDNAVWFAAPKGGFEAYFIQDGYGDRVIYDRKGGWQLSLIMYGEDKLPRDIRAAVKSIYFDFEIFLVEEVHTNEGFEYVVYLEDKTRFILVKLSQSGEMEILQDLDK